MVIIIVNQALGNNKKHIHQEQLWLCVCDRLLLSVIRTVLFWFCFFVVVVFLFVCLFVCQTVGLVHQNVISVQRDE